jgi:hypothetical protein
MQVAVAVAHTTAEVVAVLLVPVVQVAVAPV